MEHFEIFLTLLFVSVAGLNALAGWLNVPYPILLVLGGLAVGLIPGMPHIELEPDLVLLVFLPPLLYSAAFFSDLRALREAARALSMTAIGLVLSTTVAVAVVAHEVMGFTWAMAFALGAIVSPTDPVAATSIMRRVGAPRRIVNMVEGESLVNDATALVAYRVAVAAAVGGTFSLGEAALEFVLAAAGGVAIGIVAGWGIAQIRRRLKDPVTEITISLLTAYAAFIPAEELGLSGVLAAVSCGLYLGWRAPALVSPATRLQSYGVWEILVFLLNATLFILIGLQLPVIVDGLEGSPWTEVLGYSALVCAAVIGMRFLWLFTMPYVIRALDRREIQRARRIGWRPRVIFGWAGMRGAVSMAAALALPLETDAGAPLPDRELILFITFALIVITVVGQGLTLPALIRRLDVVEDGSEEEHEELRARYGASRAALRRLDELELEDWTLNDSVERARGIFRFRQRRVKTRAGKIEDDGILEQSLTYQRMMHEVYDAQRRELVRLRNEGEISSAIMRQIERELDLEESRLEV
ncbi:MAG: nha [Solirubrobacterales bacterium]|jgi:CPA1 family monovalent cation:H+ antiporter|nr:nha [Solirubrobacterales bacterium]